MMDNEEILDLQTSKPKIVKLEHVRKVSKKRRPFDERKHIQNFVLYVVDSIISMVFVAPAVVSFWRGTWELLDTYTHFFPPYKTGILGIVLHICFILIRQFVRDYCENNNKKAKRHPLLVITRRFYTYMYSVTSVIQWRGCWTAFDNLFVNNKEANLWMIILPTVSSLFVLIMFKSLTNTLATPCILILDSVEACYNIPTRFRIVMTEKMTLYVLDCIFSVLVVGTLVVFVWRGAWVLVDIFLFPENTDLSAWSSLIIGYIIVALAFTLQPGMRWICDRLQGATRLVAADLFLIFSLCGTINLWRGIWMLLNLYLLPDQKELGCWITHWLCLVLLILLGCSNSLLVRGVYIDAEEPAGKCVIFPCYYLRLIFQQERAKKIAKHLQLDTISKRKQESIENNVTTVNHITAMSQLGITETNNHVV